MQDDTPQTRQSQGLRGRLPIHRRFSTDSDDTTHTNSTNKSTTSTDSSSPTKGASRSRLLLQQLISNHHLHSNPAHAELAELQRQSVESFAEAGSGRCLRALQHHTRAARDISVSADGLLASCGDDKTVRLYSESGGTSCIRTMQGHAYDVTSVSFSPQVRFCCNANVICWVFLSQMIRVNKQKFVIVIW